jgi:hypothetical protein
LVAISLFLAFAAPTMTAAPARAAPTVVALWHMDETSGSSAVDASGLGNNGTNTSVAYVGPGFDGTGGAYAFSSTSMVVTAGTPSLNPGTADITLTAHVETSVLPGSVGDYDIIRKKQGGQIYKMEILGTGRAYCQFKGTVANGVVRGGPNIVDGRWHAIVCAKTASGISLRVDGQAVASKAIVVGSISNSIGVYLGRKPDGTDAYTGLMDEVSIAFA